MKTKEEIEKALNGIEIILGVYRQTLDLSQGCIDMVNKLKIEIELLKWVLK